MIDNLKIEDCVTYDPLTGVFDRKLRTSNNQKMKDIAIKKKNGYCYVNVLGKSYLAHRLAYYLMEGVFPEEDIDHIDRDRANNVYSNLRPCSRSENLFNMGLVRKGKFSRNVSLDKRRGTYYAQVRAFGKTHSKTGLESAELAEMVADELRSRLHKEFAYERG